MSSHEPVPGAGTPDALFIGGGRMGRLMADTDWSATALGPPERWPAGLRASVEIMLRSRFPTAICWGEQLLIVYNDAYQAILGDKHPAALGRSTEVIWPETWDSLKSAFAHVQDGGSTYFEDVLLVMRRAGFTEETYFTLSHSPISIEGDGGDAVGGIFCPVIETTARVLGERRLRMLGELGDVSTVTASGVEQACSEALAVLSRNRADLPFASVYLLDEPSADQALCARRVGSYGLLDDAAMAPEMLDARRDAHRSLWSALDSGQPCTVSGLAGRYAGRFAALEGPMGHVDPDQVMVLPLAGTAGEPVGILVAGISPFLALDEDYRRFLELVANQMSGAITEARMLRAQRRSRETALLNTLSDGLFVMDAERTVVEINQAFSDILGYGPGGLPYRWPHVWWPQAEREPDEHRQLSRVINGVVEQADSGRWRVPLRHRDGHRVWAEVSTDPLPTGPDDDRQIIGLIRDVTDQYRAGERNALLADIGQAIAQPAELHERLQHCADAMATRLGDLVLIARTDPTGRLTPLAAAYPHRPELVEALTRLIPDHPSDDLAERLHTARAFVLEPTPEDLLRPPADETGDETGDRAADQAARDVLSTHTALVAPLIAAGRLHGVLGVLSPPGGRRYDELDLRMVEELAVPIVGVMDTGWVLTRERELHEASAALAAAATVEQAVRTLADAARRALGAEGVAVYLAHPDKPGQLSLEHCTGLPDPYRDRYGTLDVESTTVIAQTFRTRQALWVTDSRVWRREHPNSTHTRGPDAAGAAAALPLAIGDRVLGVLGVSFDVPRRFFAAERAFAATLVTQAAQAFERAAMTDAHWRLAQTLQRALLPTTPPRLDRLTVSTHYQPASRHIQSGGDWYDVIPLSDDTVAVVVGDVVGNGAAAAAIMGQLRSALAAYLVDGHGPAAALARLSRYAGRVEGALASTAVCVVLHTDTGRLRWARAGHPTPLLLSPGAEPRYLPEIDGAALGIVTRPYREATLMLDPGTSVLLYTDGLVERRHEDIDIGFKRLADIAAEHHDAQADTLLAAILDGCLPDDGPPDDVALVITRHLPAALQGRVPARPEQLSALRRQVRTWSAQCGLPAELTTDLQFAVSELVTNSVEHAYLGRPPGTVDYRLSFDDGQVHVRIRDDGHWRPAPADPGHRGRGLAALRVVATDVRVDTGPGGTTVEFDLHTP